MKKAKDSCCSSGQIKEEVKKHYRDLITGKKSSCCSPPTLEEGMKGKLAQLAGYGEEERSQVPEEAYLNSFGCGNPMAIDQHGKEWKTKIASIKVSAKKKSVYS